MSGAVKAVAILLVLFISFDIYSKWTGRGFSLDLNAVNQLGAAMVNH